MCRQMGSHFHGWVDYNGVTFLPLQGFRPEVKSRGGTLQGSKLKKLLVLSFFSTISTVLTRCSSR